MRLQEVIEQTKLNNKTIYYYIKEEFISPEKNYNNGYYDFTERDVKILEKVSFYRSLQMPIQEIKNMFNFPAMTNYFMHRHINRTKEKIIRETATLNNIYCNLDNIPVNATPDTLKEVLNFPHNPNGAGEDFLNLHFPNVDNRMIAILVLAPFLSIKSNSYKKFLWDRISYELKICLNDNFQILQKLIYKLSIQQIDDYTRFQFFKITEISQASMNNLKPFEDYLYERCQELLLSEQVRSYWSLCYEPIIKPLLTFYSGESFGLLKEYNPDIANYFYKMEIICENVYTKLCETGIDKDLKTTLNNYFDPKSCQYGEMIILYTFNNGICTQLSLKNTKSMLYDFNQTL
jgi:DNA-binding transcriptional MerR regulator